MGLRSFLRGTDILESSNGATESRSLPPAENALPLLGAYTATNITPAGRADDRRRVGRGASPGRCGLEISATSKPMHPATRALNWKSADNDDGMAERKATVIGAAWAAAFENNASTASKSTVTTQKSAGPVKVATFEVE